jgi:hypothetical protein
MDRVDEEGQNQLKSDERGEEEKDAPLPLLSSIQS